MSRIDRASPGVFHNGDRGAARRYVVDGHSIAAPQLAPGLHLVATPIGNLQDVTLRALESLAGADLVACEDTRVTAKLTARYGISTALTPYHDHNAAAARPKLLRRLAEGAAIALVSDAGTPLVSDPGYKLVRAAIEHGHAVTAIPGPSSLLAAMMVAGLPSDRFLFDGYLPAKAGQRQARIAELAAVPATLVLFETGPRLADALADLAARLGARDASICRELTKLHEEVRRGDLPALAAGAAQSPPPPGEIVIVVAPPPTGEDRASPDEVEALLRDALARTSVREAVAEVAAVARLPRRDVYRRALALKDPR